VLEVGLGVLARDAEGVAQGRDRHLPVALDERDDRPLGGLRRRAR